jgi:aryl-alcohol dehydrogenase-like predicted oxidoreductase
MRRIDSTDLEVFELCLGGNVFGWTADADTSEAILDAYAAAGGNFIDTADQYVAWAEGKEGGESEAIIGGWMAKRANRAQLVVATKVGKAPSMRGLSSETIRQAAEGSLRRLQTDYIDLYYAHEDDPTVPIEETLAAFDDLVRAGKVRYIAASNYSASRLAEALAISEREGLSKYIALQPHYNLMHRREFEEELQELCAREGLSCLPYFSLANGFLTGKYRSRSQPVASERAENAREYLTDRGKSVLAVLDKIAAARSTSVATVALGWLATRATVAAPIASARTPEQLRDLLSVTWFKPTDDELELLDAASAEPGVS